MRVPVSNPSLPGLYGYKCPHWDSVCRVCVERHPDGKLYVRFKVGYYPTPMADIPADAIWSDIGIGPLGPVHAAVPSWFARLRLWVRRQLGLPMPVDTTGPYAGAELDMTVDELKRAHRLARKHTAP